MHYIVFHILLLQQISTCVQGEASTKETLFASNGKPLVPDTEVLATSSGPHPHVVSPWRQILHNIGATTCILEVFGYDSVQCTDKVYSILVLLQGRGVPLSREHSNVASSPLAAPVPVKSTLKVLPVMLQPRFLRYMMQNWSSGFVLCTHSLLRITLFSPVTSTAITLRVKSPVGIPSRLYVPLEPV